MRRSLAPGGLLIVREFVRGLSEDAALFAVNMLVLTAGGGTYAAEEYEDWLLGRASMASSSCLCREGGMHQIFARNPVLSRR